MNQLQLIDAASAQATRVTSYLQTLPSERPFKHVLLYSTLKHSQLFPIKVQLRISVIFSLIFNSVLNLSRDVGGKGEKSQKYNGAN